MSLSPYVTAIIVAAGSSTRMSLGFSKQFISLCGNPAISYTFKAFDASDCINEVVVVCRNEDKPELIRIADEYGIKKIKAFVEGGKERSESVRNGVLAASDNTTHFAVHDGARPMISTEDISKVVQVAVKNKAATLGTLVTDTIKIVDEKGLITYTPERSRLRAVQTPQVFEKELYLSALDNAHGKGFTDDCAMVEYFGVSPVVVEGSSTNLKLTTKDDIPLIENILKRRMEMK